MRRAERGKEAVLRWGWRERRTERGGSEGGIKRNKERRTKYCSKFVQSILLFLNAWKVTEPASATFMNAIVVFMCRVDPPASSLCSSVPYVVCVLVVFICIYFDSQARCRGQSLVASEVFHELWANQRQNPQLSSCPLAVFSLTPCSIRNSPCLPYWPKSYFFLLLHHLKSSSPIVL